MASDYLVDADGRVWYRDAQIPLTDAEIDDLSVLYPDDDIETTPELENEIAADELKRKIERARVIAGRGFDEIEDWDERALRFAQGVQAIWDETGRPCRLSAAGRRAQLTDLEFIMGAVQARGRGLVCHPEQDGVEYTSLWQPSVG